MNGNRRSDWEREWDCIKKMKEWIIANALAEEDELNAIEISAKSDIKSSRQLAWDKYASPIKAMVAKTIAVLQHAVNEGKDHTGRVQTAIKNLQANREPDRRDILKALATGVHFSGDGDVQQYYNSLLAEESALYRSHLYNEGVKSWQHVQPTSLQYGENAPLLTGRQILNRI